MVLFHAHAHVSEHSSVCCKRPSCFSDLLADLFYYQGSSYDNAIFILVCTLLSTEVLSSRSTKGILTALASEDE